MNDLIHYRNETESHISIFFLILSLCHDQLSTCVTRWIYFFWNASSLSLYIVIMMKLLLLHPHQHTCKIIVSFYVKTKKKIQHSKEMNGIKLWKWLHYVTCRVNLLRNMLIATVLKRAQLNLNRSEKLNYRLEVKPVCLEMCNPGKYRLKPFSFSCQLIRSRCMKFLAFYVNPFPEKNSNANVITYNCFSTRLSMELRFISQMKSIWKIFIIKRRTICFHFYHPSI